MEVLYSSAGQTGSLIPIDKGPAGTSVQLQLQPMEFTILR
jgi:hypothetical protein